MRPTSVFYARYRAKTNDLGITRQKHVRPQGSHALALYMIDNWWGDQGAGELNNPLGAPFTAAEFIARFRAEAVEIWDEPLVLASTLKLRLSYLYNHGYLAKTYVDAKNWFICNLGTEQVVPSQEELSEAKANLPTAGIGVISLPPPDLPTEDDDYEESFRKTLEDQGYLKDS